MALYGNSSTDRIEIASHASFNALQKISQLFWFYTSDLTNNQKLCEHPYGAAVNRHRVEIDGGNDKIGVSNYVNDDDVRALSTNSSLNINKWTCVAVSFDYSLTLNAIQIYLGELGGSLSNDTNTIANLSQARTTDWPSTFYLNNLDNDDTTYLRCPHAVHIFIAGKILTQAQFQELMNNPSACMKYPETVMYHELGIHGVANIVDLSGTGNSGTGTGQILGDHVPLGPPFGFNLPPIAVGITGTVCWGHSAGVTEDNSRTFALDWSGDGLASGSGDAEMLTLDAGEYMESPTWYIGSGKVILEDEKYGTSRGGRFLQYKTGASKAACNGAGWTTYTVPFTSLGWVKVRVEAY